MTINWPMTLLAINVCVFMYFLGAMVLGIKLSFKMYGGDKHREPTYFRTKMEEICTGGILSLVCLAVIGLTAVFVPEWWQ